MIFLQVNYFPNCLITVRNNFVINTGIDKSLSTLKMISSVHSLEGEFFGSTRMNVFGLLIMIFGCKSNKDFSWWWHTVSIQNWSSIISSHAVERGSSQGCFLTSSATIIELGIVLAQFLWGWLCQMSDNLYGYLKRISRVYLVRGNIARAHIYCNMGAWFWRAAGK